MTRNGISLRAIAIGFAAAGLVPLATALAQQGGQSTAQRSEDEIVAVDARTWPRSYEVDDLRFAIFQPQLDSWEGNVLKARLVMAVDAGTSEDGKAQKRYGVLWLSARTETDKEAREVVLDRLVVEKASFPNAKSLESSYLAAAREVLPTTALVASLDAIEASLAITDAQADIANVPVDNQPPDIIVSLDPAILVPIDGTPVWTATGIAGVDRVLNSEAMILRFQGKVYAGRSGKWAEAQALEADWVRAESVPGAVSHAATTLTEGAPKQGDQAPLPAFTKFPKILVRTHPAELIVIDGEPQFEEIAGTTLRYVANTPGDLFVEGDGRWYVLISGRWFTSPSTKGPWAYVDSTQLPADFQRISSEGPKGAVLASIAGTPEAKELLVANAVPQTATIKRQEAHFTSNYDGEPKFEPIAGTSLQAARNSPAPIILAAPGRYYALENGVWFEGTTPTGPWIVATSVPASIYSIPSSSALHFVTYVRVYGSNADEVYIGYTPGYYGSVASGGVVVYGTGYGCSAWVGTYYYGCPATYGYGAAFAFTAAAGWSLMFGYGWYDPWFYPGWGPWYHPGYYYPGYWGSAGSRWNVYGRWGTSVVAGTRAAWVNSWTGNYGQGFRGGYYDSASGARAYGYAGRNTNVYTGNSVAAAGGVGYDPGTGRIVAGRGAAAGNIYTGNGAAAGRAGVINTNTGRVSSVAGGGVRTDNGATVAGGGRTTGPGGNAAGAGYIHYDRDEGGLSGAGIANVNGNLYAGKDGEVYRHDENGWNVVNHPVDASGRTVAGPMDTSNFERERAARNRAAERDRFTGRGFEPRTVNRPAFDRQSFSPRYQGRMGGFRSRLPR